LASEVFIPLVFDPGEAFQFDRSHEWVEMAGMPVKVKVAHLRLCHSRHFLVVAYPRETQEMVFDAHMRGFEFFGGVCRRGIIDYVPRNIIVVMCPSQICGQVVKIPLIQGGSRETLFTRCSNLKLASVSSASVMVRYQLVDAGSECPMNVER
jgi:transposase